MALNEAQRALQSKLRSTSYYYEPVAGSGVGRNVDIGIPARFFFTDEFKRRQAKSLYPELERDLQKEQFDRDLALYDAEAQKFQGRLTNDFNRQAELSGARQVGAINAQTGLTANRLNLGDQYNAALNADQQGRLRSEVLNSQMDFQTKLGQLMYAERMGFVRGEFDFFHRLQAMDYANELSKDLARFQAKLASDQRGWDMLGQVLQVGGFIAGSAIARRAGGVAGGAGFLRNTQANEHGTG